MLSRGDRGRPRGAAALEELGKDLARGPDGAIEDDLEGHADFGFAGGFGEVALGAGSNDLFDEQGIEALTDDNDADRGFSRRRREMRSGKRHRRRAPRA